MKHFFGLVLRLALHAPRQWSCFNWWWEWMRMDFPGATSVSNGEVQGPSVLGSVRVCFWLCGREVKSRVDGILC
ncbi:hypothetical protein BDW71DRAFT_175144 [Aspergillus fruticulosus]